MTIHDYSGTIYVQTVTKNTNKLVSEHAMTIQQKKII